MIFNTKFTKQSFNTNKININWTVIVIVIKCPSGFGLNLVSSQCIECSVDKFTIKESISECFNCDNNLLDGVECLGGNKIRVSRNYWIGINNFTLNLNINQDIVSQFCPSGYCNQIYNALYLKLYESEELCALNRDSNIPLCGKCKDGYSELFGSSNCGYVIYIYHTQTHIYFIYFIYRICDRNRYELWIAFAIFSIIITIIIIYMSAIRSNTSISHKKKKQNKYIDCLKKIFCINGEIRNFVSISFSKPILYYYQSVSFILLNGGIFVSMTAFAELFNFQLDFGENNTNNKSGFCWIKGLNAKYEIILKLIIPTFCILILFILYCIYKCIGKKLKIFGIYPYFGKAFIKILLLTIGTICGICFKLISCRSIGNNLIVHFYFGNEQCYDIIWWISLCFLIFFVILFFIFFFKLCNDHKNDNKKNKLLNNDTYILQSFVKSYKIKNYWYWEIIIFSRRLIIAMINILTQDIYTKDILFILISIYLLLQIYCKPFKIEKINNLECICLVCLLFLLYILINNNNNNNNNNDNIYSIILLNILIILPLIIFIIQIIIIIFKYKKTNINNKKSVTINNNKSVNHISVNHNYNNINKMKQQPIENNENDENVNNNNDNEEKTSISKPIKFDKFGATSITLTTTKSVEVESDSNDNDNNHNQITVEMINKNKLNSNSPLFID